MQNVLSRSTSEILFASCWDFTNPGEKGIPRTLDVSLVQSNAMCHLQLDEQLGVLLGAESDLSAPTGGFAGKVKTHDHL